MMMFLFLFMLSTTAYPSNLTQFFPSSGGSGAVSGEAFITSGTSWTVPTGVTRGDVILVGGGPAELLVPLATLPVVL